MCASAEFTSGTIANWDLEPTMPREKKAPMQGGDTDKMPWNVDCRRYSTIEAMVEQKQGPKARSTAALAATCSEGWQDGRTGGGRICKI